ncbi:TMEM175 family protein [Sphingomonas sp. MMS12-HWE2-04]|uniref:TMEM175 family protein n=1 Tax=Sphingomonas sp. MMS12-HWE2-04 TaxID=3234199 RepID=UPI00384F34B1
MAGKRQIQFHGPEHALERLVFFSDAVFAIAITLLIIEVHVPHVSGPLTDHAFLQALADLTPHFISFLISFYVIGAFWAGHHRAFNCARHWDPRLLFANLMMLFTIAALPFFTAFSSEYYGHRVPVALYCGWLAFAALCNIRVQRLVTAPPVVGEDVAPAIRHNIRQRGIGTFLGASTGFVVALFWPAFAQPALITIFFWRLLLVRLRPVR